MVKKPSTQTSGHRMQIYGKMGFVPSFLSTRLMVICFQLSLVTRWSKRSLHLQSSVPQNCWQKPELEASSAYGARCSLGLLSWLLTASVSVCWVGPPGPSAPISCNTRATFQQQSHSAGWETHQISNCGIVPQKNDVSAIHTTTIYSHTL